jgi:site-specific DNA-cytosine methylase
MPLLQSLDLFSGIGGITRALHGIASPVAYCDWAAEARRALEGCMADGRLPRAPVSSDVRELGERWLKVHARQMPELIVGGFPCVGFSSLGLQKGFENSESGLFSEILRLADETRCPMLFLENVQDVLKMGMDVVAHELAVKRGYELRWCIVAASDMGAPHKRPRWFCLAVRPGFQHRWTAASKYTPHPWTAARQPPRALPTSTRESRTSMALLGNSVVPDAVRYAFLFLAGGCKAAPATLDSAAGMRLVPAAAGSRRPAGAGRVVAQAWPRCGIVGGGRGAKPVAHAPPGVFRVLPALQLVFDPAMFHTHKPPSKAISAPMLVGPVKSARWSTPRHGSTHASNYITRRTMRDLPTQVRFEASTKDAHRAGGVNPAFVEWLMGYPSGWTKSGADQQAKTSSVA